MSAKLFKETDSWGDSSGNSGGVSWSFKKNPKSKEKKKNKQAKKRNHSAIEEDPDAGKYVRAPEYYGLKEANEAPQESREESSSTAKKNMRKRKHETIEDASNQQSSSDEIAPEKKVKNISADQVKAASSFGDKLRESLKGSRFRFLNEQMYKQSGQKSLQDFKEDETAFEAYHEGYRHQVTQWPMNPLDRIINNIKRL